MINVYPNILVSGSWDNTIKLFKIKIDNYELLQVLNYHKSYINSIIRLNNKDLVSCSIDKLIIFYSKDKDKYKKYHKIST